MISCEAHHLDGFTVSMIGMNAAPAEGELPSGHMHIRGTKDADTALLGAKARIDSHHPGFTSTCGFVDRGNGTAGAEMRIGRNAFDDAQVDDSPGGAEIRKQIKDALDKGDPVIIHEPGGGETKVGRDDKGKFTFTPIG